MVFAYLAAAAVSAAVLALLMTAMRGSGAADNLQFVLCAAVGFAAAAAVGIIRSRRLPR